MLLFYLGLMDELLEVEPRILKPFCSRIIYEGLLVKRKSGLRWLFGFCSGNEVGVMAVVEREGERRHGRMIRDSTSPFLAGLNWVKPKCPLPSPIRSDPRLSFLAPSFCCVGLNISLRLIFLSAPHFSHSPHHTFSF